MKKKHLNVLMAHQIPIQKPPQLINIEHLIPRKPDEFAFGIQEIDSVSNIPAVNLSVTVPGQALPIDQKVIHFDNLTEKPNLQRAFNNEECKESRLPDHFSQSQLFQNLHDDNFGNQNLDQDTSHYIKFNKLKETSSGISQPNTLIEKEEKHNKISNFCMNFKTEKSLSLLALAPETKAEVLNKLYIYQFKYSTQQKDKIYLTSNKIDRESENKNKGNEELTQASSIIIQSNQGKNNSDANKGVKYSFNQKEESKNNLKENEEILTSNNKKEEKESISENLRKIIRQRASHYINFYQINKKYLSIFVLDSVENPSSQMMPISNFEKIVGNLNFVQKVMLKKESNQGTQVLKYCNELNHLYIMKRNYKYFIIKDEKIILGEIIDKFIESNYNEFGFMKLFNACPHSAKPIAFNVVLSFEISGNLVLTEMLMEYAGESILNQFPIADSEIIYNYLLQLINALNFLECYKLEHNDIKPANILFENVLGINVLKLIDFDIGMNESFTLKTGKGMGVRGLTHGYVSPEIYMFDKNSTNNMKINPWKSQIYSLGILILQAVGFFYETIELSEIDKFKEDEFYYEEFLHLIAVFIKSKDDILMKKILIITQKCLNYRSEYRLTANELLPIVECLKYISIDQINEEYKYRCTKIKMTRDELIQNLKNLENKNQTILKEKKELENYLTDVNKCFDENNKKIFSLEKEIKLLNEELIKAKASNNFSKHNPLFETNTYEQNSKLNRKKHWLITKSETVSFINGQKSKQSNNLESLPVHEIIMNQGQISNSPFKKNKSNSKESSNLQSNVNENTNKKVYEKDEVNRIISNIEKMGIFSLSSVKKISEIIETIYFEYCKIRIDLELYLRSEFIPELKLDKSPKINFVKDLIINDYSIYSGEVIRSIPQGRGILKLKGNRTFLSTFSNGAPSPIGVIILKDKENIIGNFNSEFQVKYGFKIQNNPQTNSNEYYLGYFKNFYQDGFGKYIYNSGDIYEGMWEENKRTGSGKILFSSGSRYEGDWLKDEFNGNGIFTSQTSETYQGKWIRNKKEGKFIITDSKGNIRTANFKNDKEF